MQAKKTPTTATKKHFYPEEHKLSSSIFPLLLTILVLFSVVCVCVCVTQEGRRGEGKKEKIWEERRQCRSTTVVQKSKILKVREKQLTTVVVVVVVCSTSKLNLNSWRIFELFFACGWQK